MANGATIDVLYFARIAELTGKRAEPWPVTPGMQGTDLLAALMQHYPDLAQASRLKLAVNQTHAQADVTLAAGDEVAVFEPVTGG